MRIVFDGMLLRGRFSGVEVCICELARGLARFGRHRHSVYVPPTFPGGVPESPRFAVRRSRLPTQYRPVRIFWQQCLLPSAASREEAAVIHSPGYIAPLAARTPVVLTVYDLIALRHPEWCTAANRLHFRIMLPPSVRKAARVIVPSDATRRELVGVLGCAESKIRVVRPGIREEFAPIRDQGQRETVKRRYGLPAAYILFVGNLEPKKNIGGLVRAFHALKTGGRAEQKLVIAGRLGWKYREIFEAVRRCGLEGEVLFPGFIRAGDLACLYSMADVFVFPSLYEGFGLPPLEAMACGTPVIVSDRGALPEAAGDAALRVDPADAARLAGAMREVLGTAGLRDDLIRKGIERSREFSWRQAAEETERVYEEVAGAKAEDS